MSETKKVISDEAVEAAAKALYEVFPSLTDPGDETTAVSWESASEQRREEDRAQARAALQAVEPWVVDWSQAVPNGMTVDEWLDMPESPYRSQA